VTRLPRPLYVLSRLLEVFAAALSIALNVVFFNGSTRETTSSRAYIDGKTDPKWARRRDFIDALFFYKDDHCAGAHAMQVRNALKTLEALQRVQKSND
jgi:hypothetical protein